MASNPTSPTTAPDLLAVALGNTARVVIDASLAIDAFLGEPARKARALRFFALCNAHGVALIVPPTFSSETDTAVRRIVARGQLPVAELPAIWNALDALTLDMALDAAELNIVRQRARQIAADLALTPVYDSTYAALAETRGCDFWTADEKFANAAKQPRRQPDGTLSPTVPNVRFIGDF